MRFAALVTIGCLGAAALVAAQQSRAPLPVEPLSGSGESVYPVYEGWGPHKDGSTVILLGYFNRNRTQAVDIPIGPNNRIEPGGPDQGQPTHFEAGQQHGVFAIRVPKEFGSQKLTWTITVNGQTTSVSFWLNPPYLLDFFKNAATENEPPVVRLTENGSAITGPPLGVAHTLSGTVRQPVALRLWASDVPEGRPGADDELADQRSKRPTVVEPFAIVGDQSFGGIRGGRPRPARPDMIVSWKMFRGPGRVAVAQPRINLVTKGDPKVVVPASTTATFETAGEYIMRAQVNDESGEGGNGDQCCWTTALVRVNVQ